MNGFELQIEWDPVKAVANRKKHGVSFELAGTVLLDPSAVSIPDEAHSQIEERWITIGRSSNGNLLTVVHTWLDVGAEPVRVRIISARNATRGESQDYEAGL